MPTTSEVQSIFAHLASPDKTEFFSHVLDDVYWVVQGHSPMSGEYHTKSDFLAATLSVLGKDVLTKPLCMEVKNVVSGGEDGQAVVELAAIDASCKNGMRYDMTYCWVVKFNSDNKISQVRAYIDTDLLIRAMEQNKG